MSLGTSIRMGRKTACCENIALKPLACVYILLAQRPSRRLHFIYINLISQSDTCDIPSSLIYIGPEKSFRQFESHMTG